MNLDELFPEKCDGMPEPMLPIYWNLRCASRGMASNLLNGLPEQIDATDLVKYVKEQFDQAVKRLSQWKPE